MNLFFLICYCFMLISAAAVQSVRVKRIVGGLEAAIPPPLDSNSEDPDESGNEEENGGNEPVLYPSDNSDVIVVINEEIRSSRIKGVKETGGYVSFKGIRYAEPPTGRNRFVRPIFSPLSGEIKATQYGSPCVQPGSDSWKTGSEDCLFLNVFTPNPKATDLPVLFWIHGGGFKAGSGSQYEPSFLVSKNIVVVTMNYRLGSLGFLGTNNQYISGNAGLFDIRAAFEWTRRYISYFGGNSKKIYTAGQGSGASVAILLGQSDFTFQHIRGVIAMSGTGLSSNAVDYKPTDTLGFISENTGCTNLNPLQTVRCLQNSDTDKIVYTDNLLQNNRLNNSDFVNGLTSLLGAGPVVEGLNDGRFLSFFLNDNPLNSLKSNRYPKIPILIGVTKQETAKLLSTGSYMRDVTDKINRNPDFVSKILPLNLLESNKGLYSNGSVNELLKNLFANGDYLNLISTTVSTVVSPLLKVIEETTDALFNLPAVTTSTLWQKSGGSSYFYSFEHISSSVSSNIPFLNSVPLYSGQETSGQKIVGHGDDLKYLFDLQTVEGEPIPEVQLQNSKDKKVREIFTSMVAEFLRTGKPKALGLKPEWPQFVNDNSYVVISDQPKIAKKFRYCQLALWGGFVEKLIDTTCNFPGIGNILKSVPNLDELVKNNLLTSTVTGTTDDVLKKLVDLPSILYLPGSNGNTNNQKGGGLNLGNGLGLGSLTSGLKQPARTTKPPPPQSIAHIKLRFISSG